MEFALAIIAVVLYSITDAIADHYMMEDMGASEDPQANKKWHRAQALRQGTVIVLAALYAGNWWVALLGASIFWVLHDGLLNSLRGWGFFHVGTTSFLDRIFTDVPGVLVLAIKGVLLIGSILALIYL